jgi:hypothetical protein
VFSNRAIYAWIVLIVSTKAIFADFPITRLRVGVVFCIGKIDFTDSG